MPLTFAVAVLRRGNADLAPPAVLVAVDRLTAARTLRGYEELTGAAGFTVTAVEERRQDAAALLRRLRRRLPLVRTVRDCAAAVTSGALSYGLLVVRAPVS